MRNEVVGYDTDVPQRYALSWTRPAAVLRQCAFMCFGGRAKRREWMWSLLFLPCFYLLMSVVVWGLGCSHCVFPVFHTEEVLVQPRLRLSRLCALKYELPVPHFLSSISVQQYNEEQMFRKLFAENAGKRLEFFPLSFVIKHHNLSALQRTYTFPDIP